MTEKIPAYERRKIAIELSKHIATLSVACIAVIVTFLAQLKELSQAKTILLVSVICFFSSVIATVFSTIITLAYIDDLSEKSRTGEKSRTRLYIFFFICNLVIVFGFLIGVASLCWLIIRNLA